MNTNPHQKMNKGRTAGANSFRQRASHNRIPCCRCKRTKPRDHFSKVQQIAYAGSEYARARDDVFCVQCTPAQNKELHCIDCEKTMPLDAFYLAQRKSPLSARCRECVDTSRAEDERARLARNGLLEYHDAALAHMAAAGGAPPMDDLARRKYQGGAAASTTDGWTTVGKQSSSTTTNYTSTTSSDRIIVARCDVSDSDGDDSDY